MSTTGAPQVTGPGYARWVVDRVLEKLHSIDHNINRMLEVMQTPRENLMAQGSVTFGGTVGTSPTSATVNPPTGYPNGVVIDANPHRRGLNIQNLSAPGGPNLTIGLGVTTPINGAGWVLQPGASWDGRVSGAVWMGSVSVVASAAGCVFSGGEVAGRTERKRNLPL
jgi:hypothetical protein